MSTNDDRWIAIMPAATLAEGEMASHAVDGHPIALYRVGGRLYATDNECTHGRAFLTDGYLDGTIIECPLHGGRFDVREGQGLGAPIDRDLKCHRARERDGKIELDKSGIGE